MNEGKQFEQDFKNSVPADVYYLRLSDSAVGFDVEHSTQRFAVKSPYDVILYKNPRMYCLELKSTKGTAVSFAGKTPMIKEHQVKRLHDAAQYGCRAGFVLNFRRTGHTYFMAIEDYLTVTGSIKKSSINEADIGPYGLLLPARKLKVHYRYDLEGLFGTEQLTLF